jgi:tetratricopeptide (TPR) repeat protein
MRRAAAFAVLALIALLRDGPLAAPVPGGAERPPDDITPVTVAAVGRWIAAVQSHLPGQRDAEIEMVSALTFEKRRELSVGMGFFLSFLHGKPDVIKTPPEERLAHMAGAIRLIPGSDPFLKRTAVLHADAAFMRSLDGVRPAEPARPVDPIPRSASAALLSYGSLYLNRDGEILGETPTDWNWPFARSLLDLVSHSPAEESFVGAWYHATTAFMFRHGLYGEAVTHLQQAAVVLPDDARILFDRGCYSEFQGLPRSQVLLSDQDIERLRAQRGGRSSLIRTPAGSSDTLGIPLQEIANEEAERLFRRALRVDPAFVEARVRLARLLEVRKRYEEAASELAAALAAHPTGAVLFYAHLFAGRAAQALGKIADAAEHYRAADALFPGSQSAGLALSQTALLQSDVPAALDAIQRVDKSSTARDPWWWYHYGAGRDADALLRAMWDQVLKF